MFKLLITILFLATLAGVCLLRVYQAQEDRGLQRLENLRAFERLDEEQRQRIIK